jgi:hypothetical protein
MINRETEGVPELLEPLLALKKRGAIFEVVDIDTGYGRNQLKKLGKNWMRRETQTFLVAFVSSCWPMRL